MQTREPGPSGDTNEAPQHRALGTRSRVAILRLVSAADSGLTAVDVVEQIGLHPSTVRAHLEQLVDAGLLMKARASEGAPGRPAWRYRAAAPQPAPGPYRALTEALLEHLASSGGNRAALQAGQAWGRRLAASTQAGDPAAAALDVLRGLGFDPRRQAVGSGGSEPAGGNEPTRVGGDVEIHLHTCPFLDLVGPQPDVMCALHAGMLRGVMQATGAPHASAVLEPFAAPNACVVGLHFPEERGKGAPR